MSLNVDIMYNRIMLKTAKNIKEMVILRNEHNIKKVVILLMVVLVLGSVIAGCSSANDSSGQATNQQVANEQSAGNSSSDFVIISGSENKALEPIIQEFNKQNNVNVHLVKKGSVDIMHDLENGAPNYDAVWPANSIWINMGDKNHLTKYQKSIYTSPVVLGIQKSVAQQLGFIGKTVKVKDLQDAIKNRKFRFMMTSATQSNSGAITYLGFLYSLLNNPDVITMDDLQKPELRKGIKQLLIAVNRSAGSSEFLVDQYLKGGYSAMMNYESLIIEANQKLVAAGKEPMYVVYLTDGLAIADSPLAYVNHGNSNKEQVFKKLQDYLLSPDVQKKILALGRRTGLGGVVTGADPKVFNSDWGIDIKKVLTPFPMPQADVINEALNMYQSSFRKPSYSIFVIDKSGSMQGQGFDQLTGAMGMLLDQSKARQNMLQSTPNDVITVIQFSDQILDEQTVKGNSPDQMNILLQDIEQISPDGGTDIYTPTMRALDIAKSVDTEMYNPAVILMTDGQSNQGASYNDLAAYWQKYNKNVPVYSITFGEASDEQLSAIAELTRGKGFDGKGDLANAFKQARGYN